MEKLLMRPYDKEYMKMAMMKHEETFKHQVYELHRLYRIQKILMKSTENRRRNGSQNQGRWNSSIEISLHHNHHGTYQNSRQGIDLEQPPAHEYVTESEGDGELEIEDESEIKLTLGPTSYHRIRKKAADTPRSASVSGPSFSSSSSTGEELTGHQWARRNSFDVADQELRQDRVLRQQHPWLFQALSLNMT